MYHRFTNRILEVLSTAGLAYPEKTWKGKIHRLKYTVRSLAFAGYTFRWFDLLRNPTFRPLVETHPRLFCKLSWPFPSKEFGITKKLAYLQGHYQFLANVFSEENIQCLRTEAGIPFAKINIPDVTSLVFVLRSGLCEKEGELTLTLADAQTNERIYSITFSITQWSDHRKELMIGGLQGHRFTNEKTRIIEITRGLAGMRPKALLLFVIQQLSVIWKIQTIQAVTNKNHIYRSIWKRRTIRVDYDSLWTESGGITDSNGLFTLPVTPIFKSMDQVKPNKRSMYRKRYAMLSTLTADLLENVRPADFQHHFPQPVFDGGSTSKTRHAFSIKTAS